LLDSWSGDIAVDTDWDGGEIAGNLFLHQTSDAVRNVHGLSIGIGEAELEEGQIGARNVTVRGNVFHGLKNARHALRIKGFDHVRNLTFAGNLFQFADVPRTLIKTDGLGPGLIFRDNVYDGAADAGQWFAVGERTLSFEQWVKESGEQGARRARIEFSDPHRGIETYMKSLGKEPTFETFIAEVRRQSKANWRKELTAPAINAWIREGFGVKRVGNR
jgi:hypothetical protein